MWAGTILYHVNVHASILSNLMNKYLDPGIFPDALKTTKIVSIYRTVVVLYLYDTTDMSRMTLLMMHFKSYILNYPKLHHCPLQVNLPLSKLTVK